MPVITTVSATLDALLHDADALPPRSCSRDARFDGRLFVGVRTTGGAAARSARRVRRSTRAAASSRPHPQHRRPVPSRACAAGQVSPWQLATWRGTSSTVARARADPRRCARRRQASVEHLMERLGIDERQLRRLFREHLGASPVSVAQTRRVLFAKHLLRDAPARWCRWRSPPVSAACAGSTRRSRAVRTSAARPAPRATDDALEASSAANVVLRLPYAPPYDWQAVHAVPRHARSWRRGRARRQVPRARDQGRARRPSVAPCVSTGANACASRSARLGRRGVVGRGRARAPRVRPRGGAARIAEHLAHDRCWHRSSQRARACACPAAGTVSSWRFARSSASR